MSKNTTTEEVAEVETIEVVEEVEAPVALIPQNLKDSVAEVLSWLNKQVTPTIASGNESHVLEVRKMIVGIDKFIGETRAMFDKNLDLAKAGMNGEDFLSGVERIFAKKEGAGRKAAAKPSLAELL